MLWKSTKKKSVVHGTFLILSYWAVFIFSTTCKALQNVKKMWSYVVTSTLPVTGRIIVPTVCLLSCFCSFSHFYICTHSVSVRAVTRPRTFHISAMTIQRCTPTTLKKPQNFIKRSQIKKTAQPIELSSKPAALNRRVRAWVKSKLLYCFSVIFWKKYGMSHTFHQHLRKSHQLIEKKHVLLLNHNDFICGSKWK